MTQDNKPELDVVVAELSDFGDTYHDVQDMKRLGKKQELKVQGSTNCNSICSNGMLGSVTSTSSPPWASSPFTW